MTEFFQARAVRRGRQYEDQVVDWLIHTRGWSVEGRKVQHQSGIELDIVARDLDGSLVGIECKGGDHKAENRSLRPGLRRSDNIWKVLGQTLVLLNWNRAQTSPVDYVRFLVVASAQPADGDRLAEPLRVAESEGQLTIVVLPQDPDVIQDEVE